MKQTTLKKNILVSAVVLTTAILSSCNKDEIPPVPQLTPTSSFSMDYSDFQQNKSANLLIGNWIYSVVNVSVFSTIASVNTTIPAIAFSESFNHTPTYIGDMTWQWSYDFNAITTTYSARLNGTVESKKVKWQMYIDKTGTNGFTNFLWFDGTTTDSTAATWTVYTNPDSPSPVLDIEWSSNANHTETSLKYTDENSGSENVGSTIEFGKSPDNELDCYYTIYFTSTETAINIEWNSEQKNGRVKSPKYYKDETWHCWNENLFDEWGD